MAHQRGHGGRYELPPGWLHCPPHSRPLRDCPGLQLIASKAPLSSNFNRLMPQDKWYTPRDMYSRITAMLNHGVAPAHHVQVRLIVDLTNTDRFYNFETEFPDWERLQLHYHKERCRGRGQTPTPESVNNVVYQIYKHIFYEPNAAVIIHCTHGFNRTGYMIVNALTRLLASHGMTTDRAVRKFAEARGPGIYKDHYLAELFRYHHEARPAHIVTPHVPDWKREGGREDPDEEEEDAAAAAAQAASAAAGEELSHEDITQLGEGIDPEEAFMIKRDLYAMITGREPGHSHVRFPGSQPVSLARDNSYLLQQHRYWVSWKADGTRYILWLIDRGAYLVNRNFQVVRLQMRFPRPPAAPVRDERGELVYQYPVGRPHNGTMLDGEMVVDRVVGPDGSSTQVRRYLVYDMMTNDILSAGGDPARQEAAMLTGQPWLKRFQTSYQVVIDPRARERQYIKGLPDAARKYKSPPYPYNYDAEAFSVRQKGFYELYRARKLTTEVMGELSHPTDGLILQSADAQYVALTDNALLKFKFPDQNSVDFKGELEQRGGRKELALLVMGGRQRGLERVPDRFQLRPDEEERGLTLEYLNGKIIECTWDRGEQCWRYMRIRVDKDTPNAKHVFASVMQSIRDDVQQDELVDYLERVCFHCAPYDKDRAMLQEDPAKASRYWPAVLPPPPDPSGLGPPPGSHVQGAPWDASQGQGEGPVGWAGEGQADAEVDANYVPRSPPYFGPEPTPPHSPNQPIVASLWQPHDPSTYDVECYYHLGQQLPPPPPLDEHMPGVVPLQESTSQGGPGPPGTSGEPHGVQASEHANVHGHGTIGLDPYYTLDRLEEVPETSPKKVLQPGDSSGMGNGAGLSDAGPAPPPLLVHDTNGSGGLGSGTPGRRGGALRGLARARAASEEDGAPSDRQAKRKKVYEVDDFDDLGD